MDRDDAISILCENKMNELSLQERKDIILSYWNIDEEDIIFHSLSKDLKEYIKKNNNSLIDTMDEMYNSLIIEVLKNDYISNGLFKLLGELSLQEREDIILSYWNIDEEDIIFHSLTKDLKEYIKKNNSLIDTMNERYDSLIIEVLKNDYIGLKNDYISNELFKLLSKKVEVIGEIESLFPCPCCRYKTLNKSGEYFICPVCNWEDDGNDDNSLDRYSFSNKKTLRQAKDYYKTKGTLVEKYSK